MTCSAPRPVGSSRARVCATILVAWAWLSAAAAPAQADPLNPLDFPSLGTVTLAAGSYTINTNASPPTLIGPGTNLSGTAPADIAVFRFDNLTVLAGASITVSGSRPIALLASGDLTFEGLLNANGGIGGAAGVNNGIGGSGGPGGANGGGGGGAGNSGTFIGGNGSNGGGAGGGIGGNDYRNEGGGGSFGGSGYNWTPFPGWGQVSGVQPHFRLAGGSGGGGCAGTGDFFLPYARGGGGGGGGGGGAVELGALGVLHLSGGLVSANGGDGGATVNPFSGGGGSGGAVLLHGGTITLGTGIRALGGNGNGGGGGGRVALQASGDPGTFNIGVEGGNYLGQPGVITFARAALTPTNVNCGPVPVGSSLTIGMIIQSTGDAGSFINGRFPASAAPFARVGTGVFSGLKQSAMSACAYTFTPTTPGHFNQNLTFLSNAGPVNVTISGTGVVEGCNPADIATSGNPNPLAGPDGFVTGEDFDAFVVLYFKGC